MWSSRDLKLGARDDDKRVRLLRRDRYSKSQNGVLQPPRMYPPSVFIAYSKWRKCRLRMAVLQLLCFLRIKGCMLLLGNSITHSTSNFYDSHTHTNNDLLCSLCSRLPLRSGCSCPSSSWQCFYYPFYVVFLDADEQSLVDSDYPVYHDGIHPSVHFIFVLKLISVRK